MGSPKLLPSGSYRVQACKTIDGKKVKKSFTVSPADCGGDARMAKKRAALMADEWMMAAEEEAHKTTVKKAIENHLEIKKAIWSPSTYKDYVNMPKHFEEIFDMDINEVNSKTIQLLINHFYTSGLSSKTITNRINFLIAALQTADIDKRFRYNIPKTLPPKLAPPEPTEFHRLLSMASPEEKLTIVLAGLYTLRRGEIGGLWGEDLLWDMNSIYIHTSLVKDENKQWVRRAMPKNLGSVRTVHLDPEIMKLFPKVGPKEPVISLNPDMITHHFERLRKKACVDCRFHDLRKYAASIRSEMMPSKYIEADGGWSKESSVMQTIYDKPFKEKRNAYAKKFNESVVQEYGKELFGN